MNFKLTPEELGIDYDYTTPSKEGFVWDEEFLKNPDGKLPEFIRKADFLFPKGLEKIDRPVYWLAGGAILSLIKGTEVNDYDLFSSNPEPVIDWLLAKGVTLTFENRFVANFNWDGKKVQVIKKYTYATMKRTIDDFDFTCVAAAYDGNRFICHDRFYLDVAQSQLVLNKMKLPLSTIKRTLKYAARGFKMDAGTLGDICRAINNLNINWSKPDENIIEFYQDWQPKLNAW